MKLKKLLAVLLALAMVFSFAACGGTNDSGDDDDNGDDDVVVDVLSSVLNKGKLVIATSPDYPPAEFVDVNTNEVMGSEMLLAQYIANSLGVELVIEAMDFNAVLTAVDTGKVDLGISGFGYKADRAEKYELSHGYQANSAAAHHTIVVLKENLDKYNSLEDFNGITIDAQANSLQEMYVTDQLKGANLQLVTSIDQAILELMSGKVDAVALDADTAHGYAETSDGKIVSMYVEKKIEFDLSLYADVSGNICAVKKGETAFMDVINQIIDDVVEKGLYSTWYYASCDAAGLTPNEEDGEEPVENWVWDGPKYAELKKNLGKASVTLPQ